MRKLVLTRLIVVIISQYITTSAKQHVAHTPEISLYVNHPSKKKKKKECLYD